MRAARCGTWLVMLSALGACPGHAQGRGPLGDLPLVERPANHGTRLALIITGDGGWAAGDRAMADVLVEGGISVVGLDARAYLRGAARNAEGVAQDVERIVDHYRRAWHRDTVVLVGYSRGADLLPFAVTRLPDSLRSRIALLALVSLSRRATFAFHWDDLVRDVHRPDDLAVAPEVAKLGGLRTLCIGGADENDSGCGDLNPAQVRVSTHPGGHTLSTETGTGTGRALMRALGSPPA